jgi:hypothetical protein
MVGQTGVTEGTLNMIIDSGTPFGAVVVAQPDVAASHL